MSDRQALIEYVLSRDAFVDGTTYRASPSKEWRSAFATATLDALKAADDEERPSIPGSQNDLAVELSSLADAQIDGIGDLHGREGRDRMRALLDELDQRDEPREP